MPTTTDQEVIDEIENAFGGEVMPPTIEERIAPRYRNSDDAFELANAIAERHWTELDDYILFYHREALGMLSPGGYRALLGAYLRASLRASRDHAPDIMGYALSSLHRLSDDREDIEEVEERLSVLTPAQRDAVSVYLRHLVDCDDEAAQILESWNTHQNNT